VNRVGHGPKAGTDPHADHIPDWEGSMAHYRRHAFAALGAAGSIALASAPLHADDHAYKQTNLVSDGSIPAAHIDPNLVNPWGIAFNPQGFVWVADNETSTSTLYDGTGTPSPVNPQPLIVSIPAPGGGKGAPTGIVFSGGADLMVTNGTASGASRFIFATEEGALAAWAPNVDFTHALIAADRSPEEAIYKGLAIATTPQGSRLFATDFHNGRVDVFNGQYQIITVAGGFEDSTLPEDYAPFGIQVINNKVYVTYAKQDEDREEEVPGPGFGYVNVFDVDGHRLARVASGGRLNAPWGIALAPHDFGRHSDDCSSATSATDGSMPSRAGTGRTSSTPRVPCAIAADTRSRFEGLWGISFGNGLSQQPTNTLFFAAGPEDETEGLYGRIDLEVHH
jgi:uncharacterized protein (TIGR03118 family)